MAASNNRKSDAAPKAKLKAQRRGRYAEILAAWALRLKGYRIVARQFRTKSGEVDIIARKGDLVIMVEVKARSSVENAINSVTAHAQKRIENAGDIWLSQQPDYAQLSIRYDIVAIIPGKWPKHFPAAW